MSNTTYEQVIYCDETVELLEVESTQYGNLAHIRFEDGREDSVPLSHIYTILRPYKGK